MPKKKHIAILGPVGISIPPKKQGGIEWMVYYLAEGLVKNGWPVLLFAPETTKTSAKLAPVCEKPISKYKLASETEASRRLRMELSILARMKTELLKRKKEIALVFNHTIHGGIFAGLEKTLGLPVFHTLHLPLYKNLADTYKKFNARLISISNSQRKPFPNLRYTATIYNGVEVKKFPFSEKPRNYFIFAGKMRSSKNPLAAIQAAKKAGAKLILAGKISDKKYFETKIKPYLNKDIVHAGEVPFKKLLQLYVGAKALLSPIKWEEPFGLVMIESMACDTPVIAFRRGSVPEVIKQGKTGFIVNNVEGMVKAMKKIDQIKRGACRKYVEENFSAERMITDYEKICQKII